MGARGQWWAGGGGIIITGSARNRCGLNQAATHQWVCFTEPPFNSFERQRKFSATPLAEHRWLTKGIRLRADTRALEHARWQQQENPDWVHIAWRHGHVRLARCGRGRTGIQNRRGYTMRLRVLENCWEFGRGRYINSIVGASG